MDAPLFRPQVLEAKAETGLGTIALGQPLSRWLLAAFALLATAAVVVFLATADYSRRTRVAGQLVPRDGLASAVSPVAGTVLSLRVREGDAVRAGDVLAIVATSRVTRRDGDTARVAETALAERRSALVAGYAAQRAQLEAQRDGVTAQLQALALELVQVDAERLTRARQQELAEAALDRYRELHARRFVTALELQQREAAALEQRALAQAAARQHAALRRQQSQLTQARDEMPARLAALDAAQQRELAALAQEAADTAARAEAVIVAAADGSIATRLVEPGQAVLAGQPLLALLPADATLEAHLAVPSRAVGFVAPGDRVLLRYDAFPYQKFGQHPGTVLRVSRSASVGEGGDGEPLYRVVVAPARAEVVAFGRGEPLRPGMRLEADLLGERRRLWEWLLEPLQALDGAVREHGRG
ncbi:HlyD family secretion protein [Arenimonas composti]|uniref:AprE-like beta-barrel domain-containing protein n=1 Tax=Arenimonas composti TR7-09 = DSM 18010 TaxID=1121013 RepID=A0A091BKH5_9GAMM|nr:HlyD family efflux transporter periplasmic adaptor subunit [Arenimonas composti]KFN51304.1 hypothetical protein P873_03285 [Arenimonas composti TR7-09 = DSM 18010]